MGPFIYAQQLQNKYLILFINQQSPLKKPPRRETFKAVMTSKKLESVTAGQNLFREDEVFVRLVSRCHPGTQTFIQKNVLGVEGLKFGVLSSADFL